MVGSCRFVWAAALTFCLASSLLAADVAGKWKAEFDSQIGVQKYIYEFKVEGNKLTGKAVVERDGKTSEVVLTDGKIMGDEISFAEALNYQGQDIRIEYKGKITGDEIKLSRKVGDFFTYDILLKRVQ